MTFRNCALSLILPAYNEATTITSTLTEVTEYFRARGHAYEIIVAADGDDGTRELARKFAVDDPAVQIIGESVRRGKGRGVRDAVRIATGAIIGFADADNKVPIEEFKKIEPWLRDGFDMVIGSRALDSSQIDRQQRWYRRIGSRGFYYFMHAVVGMPGIEDTQCGFKFFQRQVAKDLFSRQRVDGYMFDIEVLALAQRIGYRIKEVPIHWHDDDDSRLELLSGNIRNVIDVFKIRSYCRQHSRAPAVTKAAANASVGR